jgi:hypothetical protein
VEIIKANNNTSLAIVYRLASVPPTSPSNDSNNLIE